MSHLILVRHTQRGTEIDLPIVGARPYAVTLPFHLLIDTDGRVVEEWAVDLESAVVGNY